MSGPSSIIGVMAVRVAKLTSNGTPDFNNPLGGFQMCGGISSFEHSFEVEDGADIFEEDAAGNACVVRKKFDRVKRCSFTLTLCRNDYRFNEIFGIGSNVTSGQTVIGSAVSSSAGCGTATTPNGVSIELWSEQWDCDVPKTDQPYQRVLLPRCYLTPQGFTRENGVALPVYSGFSVANSNWGDGPFGDADPMAGRTGWCYAEMDDVALPVCSSPITYINIPATAS